MTANPNPETAKPNPAKIAALNDLARSQPWNVNCKTMLTQGIAALPYNIIRDIREAVEKFDNFHWHNDPHHEHDFGKIEMTLLQGGEQHTITVFWKIDYYEAGTDYGSPDPSDIFVTDRVLTIMLAEEY